VRAKTLIILGMPLLWAGPLALGYSMLRVHMTAGEGAVTVFAAWAAGLGPIAGTVLIVMKLRPLGWLSIVWMVLNVVLGLEAFAFVAVMAFQT